MKAYTIAAAGIILVATVLNISTYLVGLTHTPPGKVYTGAVHYPPDYFYYLSEIAQGADRWMTNFNLFTVETTVPQWIGWYYTLPGHLLLPIFRSPSVVYQVLTILGSILYLTAAAILLTRIFPRQPLVAFLAFLFFVIGSAMPTFTHTDGSFRPVYIYTYYNMGDAFERLTNIPHHLFAESSSLIVLLLTFLWLKKSGRTIVTGAVFAVLGATIASIQAVWWLELVGAVGLLGILAKREDKRMALLPAVILFLAGAPSVIYIKYFWIAIPGGLTHDALGALGRVDQLSTSFRDFFFTNGPLAGTAVLGIPYFIRHMTREKFALMFLGLFSLLLFFSPLPALVNLPNFRFVSVFPTLWFAAVTAELFWRLSLRLRWRHLALWLIVAAMVAFSLPRIATHLAFRAELVVPMNTWAYIPADAARAYTAARHLSVPGDVFIVPYPFDASMVGFTGRRVYVSPSVPIPLPNLYKEKLASMGQLYGETATDAPKKGLLRSTGITHILQFTWAPPPVSGLTAVWQNSYFTVYKVPPAP